MKKLHYLSLGLMLLFFNASCEQEQLLEPSESSQEITTLHFSLHDIADSVLRESLYAIATTATNQKQIGEVQWKEYPIRAKGGELKSEQYRKPGYVLLEARSPSDFDQYFIVKMLPDKKAKDIKAFSYLEAGNFSGMAYLYRPEGDFERAEYFQEGEVLSGIYDDMDLGIKTKNSLPKTASCEILKSSLVDEEEPGFTVDEEFSPEEPDCGGGNLGGRFEEVPVYMFTDWYSYREDGWHHTRTSYNGVRYETVWVVDEIQINIIMAQYVREIFASGSSSTPQPGSHAYEQFIEGDIEVPDIRIVDTELKENSKEECIHNKMKETSGNYIAGILDNFSAEGSEFTVKISSVPSLPPNVRGTTQYVGDGIINIKISSEKATSDSALEVTRTILHEYMHAEMKRKIYTQLALTTADDLTFIETYNSYESTGFEPAPEHQTMAELYLNSMAEGLASFHRNELREDYDKYTNYFGEEPSFDFYRALAWQGLSNQGVQAWEDLSEADKQKFRNLQLRTGTLTKSCE